MEATVAERGQITLPKAVRDALGLTKGTLLKVELDGSRIILRKNVDDAIACTRPLRARRLRKRRRSHALHPRSRAGRPDRSVTSMIAVDSSVLIEILIGAQQAESAETALREALAHGPVLVCDVVIAEVCSSLRDGDQAMQVLEDMGIGYSEVQAKSAIRAGEMQRRYRARGGKRSRTVPDFIVGAHALLQCNALITRDAAFFRDYFKGLKVIVPKAA